MTKMEQLANVNGSVFHSKSQMKGKYYRKNIKYWVGKFQGWGLDYGVWQEIVEAGKEGIVFVLKNDLHDFYEERKRNRTVIAWEKGKYFISVEDMKTWGKVDTLREKDGKQIFITAHRTVKVG
jgi:hypothetical protein